ncbi:MAG: hypothetical protein AAF729_00230 [Pseudomonadota bacterium]
MVAALAKTYADLASKALSTGTGLSSVSLQSVWEYSRTTRIAANGPALAMLIAQICAMRLLVLYGWRDGWRISGRWITSLIIALAFDACGLALTALKYTAH